MKNRTLLQSFKNARDGVWHVIKNERNMRIHILLAVMVIIIGFALQISRIEFAIICFTIAMVIICELINSAIEMLVDMVVDTYHPKAKIIKDVSAGAVIISAIIATIVGYFIFFDKAVVALKEIMHLFNF